jgi:S-methyl-5-thioribose-1-phosphate isomerase
MLVNQKHYKTLWLEGSTVFMIDQNLLPFTFRINKYNNYIAICEAIVDMTVRGAGAIGVAAGYAMALAFLEADRTNNPELPESARSSIENTRPTARNLFYACEKVFLAGKLGPEAAMNMAESLAEENITESLNIAAYGNALITDGMRILTHCNAGWLGFVDWGSALSPIYRAHHEGKKVFVYADETRPRGQGARLTAWELQNEGVPYTIVPDNAGAWLMANGMVDMIITGADRIAANGDTANKIGTFEKAIVAREFGIPFYIAAPSSTFDSECPDGNHIIIEQRSGDEVLWQTGRTREGKTESIQVSAPGATALNPAFDVTPASYIKGFITDKGVIQADKESIAKNIRR